MTEYFVSYITKGDDVMLGYGAGIIELEKFNLNDLVNKIALTYENKYQIVPLFIEKVKNLK